MLNVLAMGLNDGLGYGVNVVLLAGAVGLAIAGAFAKKKTKTPLFVGAVAAGLVFAGSAMGGFPAPADAPAPAASATQASAAYHDVQAITVTTIDADGGAAVASATVDLYKTGLSDKAIREKTATPEFSFTTDSNGEKTRSGLPRMIYDGRACKSSYYCQIVRNLDPSVPVTIDTAEKAFTPFRLVKIGTFDLSRGDSTVSWTAGTTNEYTVYLENTAADTKILLPAVKWESVKKGADSAATNMTLNGCKAGCTTTTVSGVDYIIPDAKEIGEKSTITFTIQVTYASGAADGAFKLTADDNWQFAEAQTWNTNANINGASSTTLTVTR